MDGNWNEDAVADEDHQSDECTDEEAVVRSEEAALTCDEMRSYEETVVSSDEAVVISDGSDSSASHYHRVTGATVKGHSSNENEIEQDEVVRSYDTE